MSTQLTRADTGDASFRQLVLIQAFQACGRCGEVASCAWPLVHWNPALGVAVIKWRDLEKSNEKPVVLVPSCESMDGDAYAAFADAAVCN